MLLRMTSRPIRLQLSRRKGFNLQAASRAANGLQAVVVARPSRYCNPYVIGRDGTRQECIEMHRRELALRWANPTLRPLLRKQLEELRGKNLACWCRIGEPCHGDTWLELAGRGPD